MYTGMLVSRKVNSNMYYLMLVVVCLYVFFIGQYIDEKNMSLIAVLMLYLGNIVFSVWNHKRDSVFFLIFHFMIFLFILSRPTIAMLRNDNWQYYFKDSTIYAVLLVLMLSMCGLYQGGFFITNNRRKNEYKKGKIQIIEMKRLLFVIAIICVCANMWAEVSSYLSFAGNYEDIYLATAANVPWFISIMSGMAPFFIIIYLSCNPSKNKTMVILGLYVAASFPSVLLGSRNVIMLRVLFAGSYFILRELYERKKKWLGRKEIALVVMFIPVVIVALGAMNYTRGEEDLPSSSPLYLVEDFFYKQGTSFDTMMQTIEYKDELLTDTYINYSFGEFVDFVLYNGVSNKVFGTTELEYGNGIKKATISNNLAHRVSYIVFGDSYLEGHGRGTTYFSELYLDFGFVGVLIFNVILGFFLCRILSLCKNGFYQRVITLSILSNIFLTPRMSFATSIGFVINYYFWMTIVAVIILYRIIELYKRKIIKV